MAGRTRTTRTRKTAEQKTAEAQAKADAAADIKVETAEEQAVPEAETTQPEATAETPEPTAEETATDAEATAETPEPATEPTEEEIAEADAKAEEERFAADVAKAEEDIIAASNNLAPLHSEAVLSKAAVDNAIKGWREKNVDSIKTLDKSLVRLSAARTTLLNEWRPLAAEDQETTTVEGVDAETPDIVYYNALHFSFDDGVAEGTQGPEKDYWLAAQSYLRVKKAMTDEPEGIDQLRETAAAAAQAYNWAQEVYNTALANKIS